MMNHKGALGDMLYDSAIYLILVALFLLGMSVFLYLQLNGAGVWSELYTKELVTLINLGQPGDDFTLHIQEATNIAKRNGVTNFNQLFMFNNDQNEVCVSLSTSGKTCLRYFNQISISESRIELGVPDNVLHLHLVRRSV